MEFGVRGGPSNGRPYKESRLQAQSLGYNLPPGAPICRLLRERKKKEGEKKAIEGARSQGEENTIWADGYKTESKESVEVAAVGAFTSFRKGDRPIRRVWKNRQGYRRPKESRGKTYEEKVRSTQDEPARPRWNGVGPYAGNRQETFDTETFAITRGIHFLALRRQNKPSQSSETHWQL